MRVVDFSIHIVSGLIIIFKFMKSFRKRMHLDNILYVFLLTFILLVAVHKKVAAGVFLTPSHDYTTFENNASIFMFNCSGNGTSLLWTVDGYNTGSSYVLNKKIQDTQFIVSPDGLTVSSQLIVPTTKANNNITVICVLQDQELNHQSSDPVKLIFQGTVFIYIKNALHL